MIYIVEDDSAIRELEQYALQSNGYEAVGFESSEPFWQAVHTAPPELVILDVMLPGEDGFSILKKLRAAPSLRRLPIIMITAKSSELDTVRGLDCGADDYITRCKLRHAQSLLKNPELSIGQVAEAIGFDPYYFSSQFKKMFLLSPTRYRQTIGITETANQAPASWQT